MNVIQKDTSCKKQCYYKTGQLIEELRQDRPHNGYVRVRYEGKIHNHHSKQDEDLYSVLDDKGNIDGQYFANAFESLCF